MGTLIAEGFGTFILVFAGTGAIMAGGNRADVSLAVGAIVGVEAFLAVELCRGTRGKGCCPQPTPQPQPRTSAAAGL